VHQSQKILKYISNRFSTIIILFEFFNPIIDNQPLKPTKLPQSFTRSQQSKDSVIIYELLTDSAAIGLLKYINCNTMYSPLHSQAA
jgi:hypothetical protein